MGLTVQLEVALVADGLAVVGLTLTLDSTAALYRFSLLLYLFAAVLH